MNNENRRKQLESIVIEKALKDEQFKSELKSNPSQVIGREIGTAIPSNISIKVLEEDPGTVYIVLPYAAPKKEGDELTEMELHTVAGGHDIWSSEYECGSFDRKCRPF
jgi:hypothetical protein